jgi:hypothetical protein
MLINLWSEYPKREEKLEDLCINRRIMFKGILRQRGVRTCNAVKWFSKGNVRSMQPLIKSVIKLRVHEGREIFYLPEQLLVSQYRLYSMELFTITKK